MGRGFDLEVATRNERIGYRHVDVDIAADHETSSNIDAIPRPRTGSHQKRHSRRGRCATTITVPNDDDDFVTGYEIGRSNRARWVEDGSRPKHFQCRSSTREAETFGQSMRNERHPLVRWRLDYDIDSRSAVPKSQE